MESKALRVCMIHEIANQAFHLSQGLARAGHKVKVIVDQRVLSEAYLFSQRKIENVEVHRLKSGSARFRGISIALPLLREIIRFRPDVIHVHYLRTLVFIATFAAILLRVPIVGVAHGSDIRGRTQTFRRALMRLFMRRVNKVIITAAHFAKEAYMVPRDKMVHIARLVDTDMFQPGIVHSDLKSKYGKNTIISVASLTNIRTPQKLIRAFRKVVDKIPSARLLLCGDGPLRNELLQLRSALKLTSNVEFLGIVPNPQLPKYYNLAAAEAHGFDPTAPSLDVAHLEALASGIPVITYVGTKEYPGVIGALTEDEIAKAIVNILSNRGSATKIGAMGRRYVIKEYGVEAGTQRTLQLYKTLLSR